HWGCARGRPPRGRRARAPGRPSAEVGGRPSDPVRGPRRLFVAHFLARADPLARLCAVAALAARPRHALPPRAAVGFLRRARRAPPLAAPGPPPPGLPRPPPQPTVPRRH